MSAPQSKKRGPTVLVTDAREGPRRQPQRPSNLMTRRDTRIISVDNVLQYASEIPSGQRRVTPGARPMMHYRTPSGKHPLDPKLSGRSVPVASAHIPTRSSKVSEKLVLLPETAGSPPDDRSELGTDDDSAPPRDEVLARRKQGRLGDKSYAERLPKARRAEKLARVTAYCTAQSFKLRATTEFIRDQHAAKTKLYDDCLYCVYQLPLLGGSDGFRIRSSPVLKNPGGKSILDEQIEANENRAYREGWRDESDEYSVIGIEGHPDSQQDDMHTRRDSTEDAIDDRDERRKSTTSSLDFPSPRASIASDATSIAELFIYSYGVAVFWNFTEHQEKDILADLTFSSSNSPQPSQNDAFRKVAYTGLPKTPLLTKPLSEDDFETEEFHFEYNNDIEKPRIFNDMITLRTSDHMIKLAMSHAIGQSTKLSFFEERMARTMNEAQYVPRKLALEGRLGMSRTEVVALVGKLFEGRVDVNLSSNMLDTPNFFWDSEPMLHPLYQAVREYLEIKPRVQVLNERCRVFLDLAEILSDSIADTKMTRITWIIIVLIILSILVTCSEVILRFGILTSEKGKEGQKGKPAMMPFASPAEL
ncbi:DUF155-domain-containing protein [Myriangium duriaei CBS 260.36]|uniref:DUF155-domain-containing protein n=1 Tax=Myriangium duriaei CBS 260.36 TaxID=1168546 RepID=A0A9P4IX32_9PEZI|nr:DUF155-domain-containing protein [Myriangium duriaei CBS 260.36]